MKKLLIISWLFIPLIGLSQGNIPVGSWRTHFSYNNVVSIAQSNSNVYAASNSGIFIISKSDNSITSLTKLNGLSDSGIAQIGFNEVTNTLVIAYKNGQLDLLHDNTITSIPDIKLSNILDSKITHHVYSFNHYIYLSTDFGVVQIDTRGLSIKESFLHLGETGEVLPIYASTISNDSLFLATKDGMMAGSLSDNLKDYTKWKRFDIASGINKEAIYAVSRYEGKPITGTPALGLLTYENGIWNAVNKLNGENFLFMAEGIAGTIITTSSGVYELEPSGFSTIESEYLTGPKQAIEGGSNFWVADKQNGVLKVQGANSESIYPDGPYFSDVEKIVSINKQLFALPQYRTTNGFPARNDLGVSVFEDGLWTNYNATGNPNTLTIPEFMDISGVAYFQNNIVFSSYGYGLMEWNNESFTIIDESNSPLVNSLPPGRNVLIADVFTSNQGLWVLNNNTIISPIQLWNTDQSWSTYTGSDLISNAKQLLSTPWGDQWMSIEDAAGGGLHIFNVQNGEVTLKSDGTGTLPDNSINDFLLDNEDKLWIATNKGVVYYARPYSILDDAEQEAIIPIIDNNLLFYKENVNTLAVDGGNRIWMGTNKGAWLFDKDGSELIEHFTSENSPLLSDVVTDIAINHLTGEIFFSTNEGLISYRGSGTLTGTYDKPKIFPNPVAPGYSGVITIEGVPFNSELKVTDASGRLVTHLEANGNTAIWDMKNEYLSDVGTGVYFVFASSEDGTERQLGKIAIVK